QRALDALVENGVVTCFAGGSETVYLIGPEKHLIASYYRNTIIHFFVTGAIAELALLRAAGDGVADPAAEFWDETMRLRDLLKFEFFFAEKEAFREELREEVGLHDAEWESRLTEGPGSIDALLRRFRPFSAHRVLRPFVEATASWPTRWSLAPPRLRSKRRPSSGRAWRSASSTCCNGGSSAPSRSRRSSSPRRSAWRATAGWWIRAHRISSSDAAPSPRSCER